MNSPPPPLHILLAEDEAIIALTVAEALEMSGYRVTVAHNGLSALTFYKQDRADILITDVMMPGMDGVQLAEGLRLLDPALPVLVISAYPPPEQLKIWSSQETARTTVLLKPVGVERVLMAVEKLLAPQRFPTA